ncbi:LamG-like jellyroll fold domain-containing protein [Flavobacterium sp. J27]|uniref:LamG-like jellyroll fold domain-containing protein n=1 Tax=Flavobacterium sp. J27 TaxID=2060419 RepID=UPI001030EB2A|nr:LamG-like jellyroll fold domain-containing protein [Flavobacterium sp. J27]
MTKKLFLLTLLVSLFLSFLSHSQTVIPGDSLVYGPMFSPIYNNSVRVWILTKNNTGSGNVLSLSLTGTTTPNLELTGQVYNSDDRLGYSLRSYEFTGLTVNETYSAKLLINGITSSRTATIKNENQIIDDFEFLSGGCGRIYDTSRCIDLPESQFHINGDPEMFNVMASEESDMMIWLGDAVYLLGLQHAMGQCPDGIDDWANKDMAFERYMFFRGFHDNLTMAMPQLAITDNHDLGPNEFDKNMPTIAEMREIFMDWWPNPQYNSTSEGQGLFSSYKYKDVEYFLTDNRSFRDGTTQHFGPEQLDWLKQALLNSTATFKIIINGTPTFTPVGGRNFSVSTQATELLDFIQNNNINGVLSLSADIHEQRFMIRDSDTKYPLYDILSGNINSDVGSGNYTIQYNSNTIVQGVKQTYLRINVFGDVDDRRMKIEYVGADGQPYFEEIIHEDMLTSLNTDAYKLGLLFQNSIVDVSTYAHVANASNYNYAEDRNGIPNEALLLDATTSFEIPANSALHFQNRAFSLAFWVNPALISSNGATILSNGQNGSGISFGISSQGNLTYTDHATNTIRESNYSLLPNSWSYITWKYDNVKRKLMLYYNGFLIQSWTNVVSPILSGANITIGNNFENKQFIGRLDDIALYGRLISDEHILQEADIQTNRGGVLKMNASQMVIPGNIINPVLTGDFTIEFWGKLNSDPSTNYKILSSNGRVNGNSTGLSFEFPDSNKLNVVFGTNSSGWNAITEQGESWNIGEWNHIALVVSNANGTIQYYQNGNLIGTGTYTGYISNSWGLGLGYSPYYNSPVQGEIDELHIWQRALSQTEINAHRHYSLIGNETDLALYYDFDPLTQIDTNIISKGSISYDIPLDGATLITATSPIGNIELVYQDEVSGKWSKNNVVNNHGLSFPNAITTYNSNIIIGKKADSSLEVIPGMTDMYYANGGWKIDPLNSPFATLKINLQECLTTHADSIANVAGQYYLIKKDQVTNVFSIVNNGSFDGTNITFYNVNLEEAVYYLGWKEENFVPGRGGAFVLANGHDVRIHYTPVEIIMGGAHTFEMWINIPDDPSDKTILSNHGRISNNTTGFTLELESNNTLSAVYGTNTNAWTKVNTGEALQMGEWNHIAVTALPGGEVKIYLNGELKQSASFVGYAPNNTWDFAFGKSINYGGQVLYIADEFRIWDLERTQNEIVEDMHRILDSNNPNLRFYYTFDQEDNGTLNNDGTNVAVVTYTNASIIDSTSPVANITPDFNDTVSASWSYINEPYSGIYVGQNITNFTQNVVFGRNIDTSILELPNTSEETHYIAGGWYINPLNITTTTITVDLSYVFDNVQMIDAIVANYLLIKGDPQSSYETVGYNATAVQGKVTFDNVSLTPGNYYIAYEVDTNAAIIAQGGVLELKNEHQVYIPKDGVNTALSGAFTIELWGKLNTTAGANTKLVGFTNFGGGEYGWEMEFLGNQTLQTITGKGPSGGWNTLNSSHVWSLGEWNHVAVTFVPNGEFKFYINGELVDSLPVTTFYPCSNDLAFGKNIANNAPINASIDEFRIWTFAKSQAEIQNDMYLTISSSMQNLAYNYTFNQADNGNLQNFGLNNVTVSYTNAAIIPATTPVRDMETTFRNFVRGNWSVMNDTKNGMYAATTITDKNSNLVIGREIGNDILPILGSTTTDTLYLNSRFKIDPLFISSGNIKVDLTKIFGNLNQSNLIANEYYLLIGDPAINVEILSTGTKVNNIVSFGTIPFDETPVYLAWKNINEYPTGTFPIASNGLWKYNDNGIDLGSDWKDNAYDDSNWAFGNAILGYGDGIESTTLNFGSDTNNKYPTYYLRHIFNVDNAAQYGNLLFKVLKDDGVVVYVNGNEAFRMNMPQGLINYNTLASTAIGGTDEEVWNEITISNLLQDGENVIAVELHQASLNSSDLRFDMEVNFQLPAIEVTDFPLEKDQEWYYFDQGTSLDATNWNMVNYNNLSWSRGFAPLGYGDTVNTTISYGPNASNKYITSYFSKDIMVDLNNLTNFVEFGLRRDDGAIVYVNGVEVFRNNMPTTGVDYLTTASTTIDGINENIYFITSVPKTVFSNGINRIAVEVHQQSITSSDLRFDMYIKNVPDWNVDCSASHIGCFTSIQPTAQTNRLIISEAHDFQLIFKQGDAYISGTGNVPGNNDFTAYIATNGSSEIGHLSVNHENTPGGVSMIDLHLNTTNKLWEIDDSKPVDFYNNALVTTNRNCSGGITPWGTVVTAEESTNSGDVNGDGYQDEGWLVEIDPVTALVKDYGNGQEKLWAMGRMNHENVVISSDGTTAYYGEDGGTHCVYKYVMNTPGNLSSGTVYVLKLDLPLSGNDPSSSTAQWVQVPNSTQTDRNNLSTVAASLGGTNFNGVEDCDISPLDGKIYFAAKGKDRVYRFKDNGTTISEFETFVGGKSYDIVTNTGTVSEPWGDGNDNLVFDDKGNLWVCEDGGNNYIWVVRPDHSQSNPNVLLFASMPAGSEPTGLTFTPDFKYGFFSVQHPSVNNASQPDAKGNNIVFNASSSIVFSLEDNLGIHPLSNELVVHESGINLYPNPTHGFVTINLPDSYASMAVNIKIIDLLGRELLQLNQLQSNADKQLKLNLEKIIDKNQMVILQVEVGDHKEEFKVLFKK